MRNFEYRVFKTTKTFSGNISETSYEVRTVYYNEQGEITSVGETVATPSGETLEELGADIGLFKAALSKPVLEMDKIKLAESELIEKAVEERPKN